MNKITVPIFIEQYLSISKTFIYRQIIGEDERFEKEVIISSNMQNVEIFPFNKIILVKKNLPEFLIHKFYEKSIRDRGIFNKTFRTLSSSQKRHLLSLLDHKNIRFIHAHFGTAALEISPIVKLLKKKLLISFHGIDASKLLNSVSYINQLKDAIKEAEIIVPSYNMKDRLQKKVGEAKKWHVVYYGIPVKFFNKVERIPVALKLAQDQKIKILQVSNFVEKKGHKYTLYALQKILDKYKNVEVILAGDGPLRAESEMLAKQLNIKQKIRFLGKVEQEQVKKLMEDADIFVHHSITSNTGDQEGIPNVIMEAMATGLPVVSTVHSGIPELITDGKNGFLVPEKNINEYISKIEILLTNKNLLFADEARSTIENKFNLDKQIDKLHAIYYKLSN